LSGALLLVATMSAKPTAADEKGSAVLKEAFKKLGEAKTMTADVSAVMDAPGAPAPMKLKGTVAAMKPNFFRWDMQGPGAQSFYADGKSYYIYISQINQYVKQALAAKPTELPGMWEGEVDAFFGGEKNAEKVEAMLTGSEKVGEVDCDVVKVEIKDPDRTATYSIGKSDRLIYKAVLMFPLGNGRTATQTNTLSNIKLNVKKKAADFEFKPPAGAKLFERPQENDFEASLLPVGKPAPDFELPTPTGGRLSLSDARKGKKAVLINFWFYN
jgi:outer membrane lipoprotein-sorting protein